MKNRIFICTGYFHLITIVATIKTIEKENSDIENFNDILILYKGRQDLVKLRNIALKLHNFSHVLINDEVIFTNNSKIIHSFIKENNIKIHQAFLHPYIEDFLIMKEFPCDELFFISEGIGTIYGLLSIKDACNYKGIYLLINEINANLNNIKIINNNIFKELIEASTNKEIIKEIFNQEKEAIIFSLSDIPKDDEVIIQDYKNIILLLKKNYPLANLYIKPHPRNLEILDYIVSSLNIENEDNVFIFKEDFLLESLFSYQNIKFVIGNYSSILLHSLYLYNIPSFYHYSDFKDFFYKGSLLTYFFIPSFSIFLQSSSNIEDFTKDFKETIVKSNKHYNKLYINFNKSMQIVEKQNKQKIIEIEKQNELKIIKLKRKLKRKRIYTSILSFIIGIIFAGLIKILLF